MNSLIEASFKGIPIYCGRENSTGSVEYDYTKENVYYLDVSRCNKNLQEINEHEYQSIVSILEHIDEARVIYGRLHPVWGNRIAMNDKIYGIIYFVAPRHEKWVADLQEKINKLMPITESLN